MSQPHGENGTLRAVLFAMRCAFSGPVLDALCAAPDIDLAAVVLPGRTPETDPMRACGRPLIDLPDRSTLADPGFRVCLENFAPDVIIVACFPWRLPRWLLDLPPRGCLNLHPSLLPKWRGPEPVFWAFRHGLRETGVTLHRMNEAFDAGPIIAQQRVPIPEGATIPALELELARIGAGMVLDHLRTSPERAATPVPQREEDASYAPMPTADDLVVLTSWDAERAARFIHAVTPVYGPVPILVLATGQRLIAERVFGVSADEDGPPVTVEGDVARVRFTGGIVSCGVARVRHPVRLYL